MSSQLEQLFGYLERDGVTEILIASGRPISMRKAGALTNITARPLGADQLSLLVRSTGIQEIVPDTDGEGPTRELTVGRRRAVAQVSRRGHEIVISLKRSEAGTLLETQPMARIATPPPAAAPPPARAPAPPASLDLGPVKFKPAPAKPPAAVDDGISLDGLSLDGPLELDMGPAHGAPAAAWKPAASTSFDDGIELGPPTLGKRSPAAPPPPLDGGLSLEDGFDLGPPIKGAGEMPLKSAPHVPRAEPFGRTQPMPPPVMMPAASASTTTHIPRQPIDNASFPAIVRAAREAGASDLHIAAARVTSIRVGGGLVPLEPDAQPQTRNAVDTLLLPLLSDTERDLLAKQGYVDLAIDLPGGGRLRANISRQQQGLKGTFRLALAHPLTLEQLGLPSEVAKVVAHHQGLVVIAGPSGQGKTSTLAALVDLLNGSKPYHILTIEDPVEIVHARKQAVVSQRETGRHTASFARGLKASLREDPDVIVIGELRDRDSVEIALTAAETGHLVIATMSTPSAAKTIDRLIDMFPPDEQSQVRASVAGALRAIVAQRLLPKRGGGIVPVIELVTGVLPLAVLIRDDKLYQLPSLMQRGKAFGMIRFDESLAEHVRAGRLDEQTALDAAESKKDLAATLRGNAPAATQPVPKAGGILGFGKKDNR